MRRLAIPLIVLLTLSGCLGGSKPSGRAALDYPPGWDTDAPERSFLATEAYYPLDHSTTFLAKETGYARYVVKVGEPLRDVQVFFSATNLYSTGRGPSLDDDAYHFELMQIRPLGKRIVDQATNAATQFGHTATSGTFTLAYLYGKGANYQYLAPYDGDPNRWDFEPGFYEFVIATDEKLTVGINVRTGSDYWTTHYHPQELGEARAEALDHFVAFHTGAGGRMPEIDEDRHGLVRALAGETLNYFVFSDVLYLTGSAALAADGAATVSVDGRETVQRMQVSTAEPSQAEAYAFAVGFNEPGPASREVRVRATFQELASLESSRAVLLMLFAVALHPTQTLAGIPTP